MTEAAVPAAAPFARIYGEPLVDIPVDLYIPPDALEILLDAFQGPLDLLLYLIRKQNLDVLDIPMAPLTRQYLEYVELMRSKNLELAAEYLVMAAMLPWQFFATAMTEASNSMVGNSNLISKVYFPRLVVPAGAVITSFVDFLITMGLLALFTHNHLFWVIGLFLAMVDLPDFGTPLRRIAGSVEKMAGVPPEGDPTETPPETARNRSLR